MQAESVRSLKAEINQDILGVQFDSEQNIINLGVNIDHANTHRFGLGIASAGKPNEFKLALRLESENDLSTPEVARILSLARGEVDIQVTGPISVLEPALLDAQQSSSGPLRMGSTVGIDGGMGVGTAGVFVRERGSSDVCLLSNNHVLANSNQARLGTRMFHYANADLQWAGHLKAFQQVRAGGVRNQVDCAIAKLDSSYSLDVSTLIGGGRFGGSRSRLNHLSMAVSKVGRTTDRTHGYVSATEVDTWIGFGGGLGGVYFVNQIEIRGRGNATHFSQPGDSGSLVMDRDHNAFGLLFAGSRVSDTTYCNDIGKVFEALNIELFNAN